MKEETKKTEELPLSFDHLITNRIRRIMKEENISFQDACRIADCRPYRYKASTEFCGTFYNPYADKIVEVIF